MKSNWPELVMIATAMLFIAVCVVSCVIDAPYAMSEETNNQRHIAAKTIQHTPGWYEYQQFTMNNK